MGRNRKQELGMTDYQVRGWLAWHHHMALVMMAMAFTLSDKIVQKQEMPDIDNRYRKQKEIELLQVREVCQSRIN